MRVKVTEKEITEAKQRDSTHCMIADAIRARCGAQYISVDLQSIKFSVPADDKRYVYLTPPDCQRAIIAFDQGKPVKPFAFSLRKPIRTDASEHQNRLSPEARKQYAARARKRYALKKAGKPVPVLRQRAPRTREYGVRLLSA